ncbi:MAG: hypothetical protein AB1689_13370, partial [Thermodesulfobacteriota bacterium]
GTPLAADPHMKTSSCRAVCAALLLAAAVPPAAAADEREDVPPVKPPGGEVLEMSEFYSSSVAQTGEFPGKLVCLRSDRAYVPVAAEECSGKRVFALAMERDNVTRPIIAGSDRVHSRLNELLGQEVRVTGRYDTNTGMLLASAIEPYRATR